MLSFLKNKIILNIKKPIIFLLDIIKNKSGFSKLNKTELQGFTSIFFRFHFLSNTKVNVPFSLGRTVRGVSYINNNLMLDPAARICKGIMNEKKYDEIYEDISNVFDIQKCCTAADILNLKDNHILKSYPAWAAVMPWEKINIEDMFDTYPESFYKNRTSQGGLIFESSSRECIINMMYSSKFIKNRIDQYKKLYESIKNRGILKSSDIPKINILIRGNEWRWFMGDGGNHRSYIYAFLGHIFFTARVNLIIKKNEVNKWHNVKNGTYSQEEAENIFDSYFDGSRVYRGMV